MGLRRKQDFFHMINEWGIKLERFRENERSRKKTDNAGDQSDPFRQENHVSVFRAALAGSWCSILSKDHKTSKTE